MTNSNCSYCGTNCNVDKNPRHRCLSSLFYEGDSSDKKFISNELIEKTAPDHLASFSFRFENVKTGKFDGFLWMNPLYQPYVYITDRNNKEIRMKVDEWIDDGMGLKRAEQRVADFKTKIEQKKAFGQSQAFDPNNRTALTQATPTPDQISELIKKELSQIDLTKYLQQLEALTGKNQAQLTTLQISPQEHAQAIARLQAIQAELEKRKKIVQQLAQEKITEQLQEQKHQLEIVQRQLDAKGQEVEAAKQAGQIAQAKQLNEEYNELRRKQAATTALILNLEENVAARTFVQFTSLADLYNPDYSVSNTSQVTVTVTEPSWGGKITPYLWWGGAVLLLIGILYLAYRFFFKELD